MSVYVANKRIGETPLQCVDRLKRGGVISGKVTYAGRLDPMASGVLVLLSGDDIKEKDSFLGLDKVYEVEVLFGVETDTLDILGVVKRSQSVARINLDFLNELLGCHMWEYPMYSSRTVEGRPLWEYARNGEEVQVPKREMCINSISMINTRTISSAELFRYVNDMVVKVNGDFRQGEVVDSFEGIIEEYFVAKILVSCTSGTYMRVLAKEAGKLVSLPAMALSIHRVSVGKYVV